MGKGSSGSGREGDGMPEDASVNIGAPARPVGWACSGYWGCRPNFTIGRWSTRPAGLMICSTSCSTRRRCWWRLIGSQVIRRANTPGVDGLTVTEVVASVGMFGWHRAIFDHRRPDNAVMDWCGIQAPEDGQLVEGFYEWGPGVVLAAECLGRSYETGLAGRKLIGPEVPTPARCSRRARLLQREQHPIRFRSRS